MENFYGNFKNNKELCTFPGRPPRIPRLYFSFNPSLDISDGKLTLEYPEMEEEVSSLVPIAGFRNE